MFSKAFDTWIRQNDLKASKYWSNYLAVSFSDMKDLRDCLESWYAIRSLRDLESFIHDNSDNGIMIIDHTGHPTIIHHVHFHTTNRVFAYTTNKFHDNPIEVIFPNDLFKPITPPFPITWHQTPTLPDTTPMEDDNTNNDNSINAGDGDNTTVIDDDNITKPLATRNSTSGATNNANNIDTVKKKRHVKNRKSLHIDSHVINSHILIPPALLAQLLVLQQPFELRSLRNHLDDFGYIILSDDPDRPFPTSTN
jgi:hypothetical protein